MCHLLHGGLFYQSYQPAAKVNKHIKTKHVLHSLYFLRYACPTQIGMLKQALGYIISFCHSDRYTHSHIFSWISGYFIIRVMPFLIQTSFLAFK